MLRRGVPINDWYLVLRLLPGDLWLTFKIYERSAQSLEERPSPIQLKFEFEEESDEHQAFKDWINYGKPALEIVRAHSP